MKLLITGISGFAGSTLAAAFRESHSNESLQIIGIDNYSRNGSWINRPLLQRIGARLVHGDIRNASDLEAVSNVDWVIDAAANPSVLAGIDGRSSSRQLIEHNLGGTINLLEFCKARSAGFILLSTSRVYSIPVLAGLSVHERDGAFVPTDQDLPSGISAAGINETCSTAAPISLYGASKLASEQLALEYSHCFGFPVWINRCGVLAGAGQFGKPDQGIFAYWLHSWRERSPLRYIGFSGSGHQVRDCLHPRDLAGLLYTQTQTDNDSQRPRIVNLSGGLSSARSLAQLSHWCTARWGPLEVTAELEPRPFDLPWIVLDHQLATATWDWHPQTTTEQILQEIAGFAENNPHWLAVSQ